MAGLLAVALHDVEPRTSARVREIRAWLAARGIGRVTLLVIPAADLHPIGARSPALCAWLRERVACGDAVAQHGLAHRTCGQVRWPRSLLASWQGGAAAEFPGLGRTDASRRVTTGLSLLREIELDPAGFVAPGYAYTPALREVLRDTFEWFADLRALRIGPRRSLRAPALCLGASTAVKRALSPAVVRTLARASGTIMRVDVHPADFDLPGHVTTLEWLLELAGAREVVTYDQLAGHDQLVA